MSSAVVSRFQVGLRSKKGEPVMGRVWLKSGAAYEWLQVWGQPGSAEAEKSIIWVCHPRFQGRKVHAPAVAQAIMAEIKKEA